MRRVESRRLRAGLGSSAGVFMVLLLLMHGGPDGRRDLGAQVVDPCAATPVNPIACENSKPGNPTTEWDVSGAGSASIQGFATDISVNRGQTVGFKVSTVAANHRIDIYRLGYYAGAGARRVAQISVPTFTAQPACLTDAATGLVDCGNWAQTASWNVPADAVSGVYIAKLVRTDATAGASHMVFIVRDDTGLSDVLFQTSDSTWQAYNQYGGNSLSAGSPVGRAYKVSYNRPFTTRGTKPEDWLFNAEYPMLRWLEANGYNVSYTTGVDTDRRGAELLEHKVFMSVGHDEFWSGNQRASVEAARNAGVNLAFFSGNEIFWKTRWENSLDASGTPYRTLVSYKETHANAKIDPLPGVWTGTWRDPRFSPPDDGGRPENALTGTLSTVNGSTSAIAVPEALGKLRLWRNTSVATLAAGQTATLAAGTLGHRWDEALENGFKPAGLIQLSSTTLNVDQQILDYGSNYGPGVATHSLTMYRAASGALVFGAGTVQWSWGLDAMHDRTASTPDVRMRQATVNLLADMNVQPSTLQSGLVAAIRTTDLTAPTTAITAPASGAGVVAGTSVTISGTAADTGGAVARVEVSTDGGTTWLPATGRASWTLPWIPGPAGSATLRARAIDDSGNLQSPGATVTVTVTAAPVGAGPVAAFGFNEGSGATTADVSGNGNNGTLEGATWTAAGRNGNALSFNGTSSMVTVADSNSLDLSAGMTLEAWVRPTTLNDWETVILKERPSGLAYSLYSHDGARPNAYISLSSSELFANGTAALPANTWTHLAATFDGATLRLFVNGAQVGTAARSGGMVTSAGLLRIGGNAIWGEFFAGLIDDVRIYARALSVAELQNDMNNPVAPPESTPPTVTSVQPVQGSVNVPVTSPVSATFNEAIAVSSLTTATFELRDVLGKLVPSAVTYDAATRTATVVPSGGLAAGASYSATVRGGVAEPRVKDLSGNPLAASVSWAFTTAPPAPLPAACPCTIWPQGTIPSEPEFLDTGSIELGVKFQSDRTGYITGIRYYKGLSNTGAHTGALWSAAGALLGTVSFANETSSGWQQALFTTPIQVTANTIYVASYHAPVGRYAADPGYFATARDNPPLHAVANATSANGVYRYAANTVFPDQSFGSSNYWVDVVFADTLVADTTPPVMTSQNPAPETTGVLPSATVSIGFNEAMNASTISGATFELRNGATLVPATVSYSAATMTATLQPTTVLTPLGVYTATVRGGATEPRVKDAAGNAMAANVTWSFTVGSLPVPPNEGPGGPVLIVSYSNNPVTRYLGEIVRTEGFNLYTVTDISMVTATLLNSYDVVVLGEMPLTAAQVTMLSNWVTAGGNLIAMRPDKQLATLLGLVDANTTLSNQYLRMGATGAGAGLVQETIQFHGTADRYTLSGATAVATLYSNATTATVNPAVSLRSVGSAGGQAAAFSYDLARSVVMTRQGNPAWAGQDRDGGVPSVIRSVDMFFGAAAGDLQPDWVDLNKVAIPQADEQQRLLANLIVQMNMDRKPLPRAWYLPRGAKAAVVMTGDDHGTGGTAGRFDAQKAVSPAGCSVADWQCIRSTSYIYSNTPMTNAEAVAYNADGFEVALHVTTGCGNYTAQSLTENYTAQLAGFVAKYTGVPAPSTNRTHCIVWSDYASQALVSLAKGIRFDTNYYYWPASWVQDRPGMFTGSGMPMRFANVDGSLIDVYQAATQMTDESGQTFPFTADTLLDRAVGPLGFYGVFTANMHTDAVAHASSSAIVASAQARNVPVVSAKQMLTWLDGRNASSFSGVTWSGGALSFTVNLGTGANGLQVLLPRTSPSGPLVSVTRAGTPVAFTVETIKGIEYATFVAPAGGYSALFTNAPNTTLTSTPPASTTSTAASFTFTSSPAGATFQCSLDGSAFTACATPTSYSGLSVAAHTFSVRAVSAQGTDPTPATFAWTITPPPPPDTTLTSTPAASTTATSASFSFTSTPAGATFQCSLDGAAFSACTTPANYSALALGSHTFAVRAVNANGPDATPATFAWTITLPVPDTTLTATPAASTTSTSASFSFTSTPAGATFECSLDAAAFTACVSPQAYAGLAVGGHTFSVRAVNATGTDATPATFAWTITALVVPDTTLTGTPAASTTSTSATFTFTSTPAGATFECSLDGAAYTACTTPRAYSALAVGSHTFGVRAVNAAGTDASPATFAWTITSGPVTGLVAAYGFEEGAGTTTADLTGGGKTGTLANATWATAGRFGRALSFNGTNAMVTIADANALDLTNAMTLEAWVRPAVLSDWQTVLLKETPGGLSYGLYGHNGTRPSAWIRVGSNELGVNGTATLAANAWAHLAMTFDGANLRLYVNGVLVATRAQAGSVPASTGVLRIGGNSVWGEFFNGLIDEVRIYSRVLTAAEITTDMNAAIQP